MPTKQVLTVVQVCQDSVWRDLQSPSPMHLQNSRSQPTWDVGINSVLGFPPWPSPYCMTWRTFPASQNWLTLPLSASTQCPPRRSKEPGPIAHLPWIPAASLWNDLNRSAAGWNAYDSQRNTVLPHRRVTHRPVLLDRRRDCRKAAKPLDDAWSNKHTQSEGNNRTNKKHPKKHWSILKDARIKDLRPQMIHQGCHCKSNKVMGCAGKILESESPSWPLPTLPTHVIK